DIHDLLNHNGGQGNTGGSGGGSPAHSNAAPPRLIGPLSGSVASTATPQLRWQLAAGTDGAAVDICGDRACGNPIFQTTVTGTSVVPSAPLPAGHVFWRARGTAGGVPGRTSSAVWELFIPHRVTAASTAVATWVDFNGDGYSDFVLSGRVLLGGPSGYAGSFTVPGGPAEATLEGYNAAGDVNGDGFGDLIRLDQTPLGTVGLWTPNVFFGGAQGFTPGAADVTVQMTGAPGGFVLGNDVNGDGYADSVFQTRFNLTAYYGSAAGISDGPPPQIFTSQSFTLAGGDVNGDGFSDAISGANGVPGIEVTRGSAAGFLATGDVLNLPSLPEFGFLAMMDANGDGFADAAVGQPGGIAFFAGSPAGLASTPFATLANPSFSPIAAGDFNGDGQPDIVGETSGPGVTLEVHYGHGGVPDPAGVTLTPPTPFDPDPAAGAFGDVNGDGFDDLTVGLFTTDPVTQKLTVTSALLYLGGPSGLSTTGIPQG
ncbi:MAG TPA: VCBS repeat-containing protein, partial [Trebonia sp.]|nr:VCBS repeat-containing protein [Trebonia sp.]